MAVLLTGLAVPAAAQPVSLEVEWRFVAGDVEGAEDPTFDDADWEVMPAPGSWDGTSCGDRAGLIAHRSLTAELQSLSFTIYGVVA